MRIAAKPLGMVKRASTQALEFSSAFKEIIKELRVIELFDLLLPMVNIGQATGVSDQQKSRFLELLLDANAGYRQLMTKTATREITESLSIGELLAPARLSSMVAVLQAASRTQDIWSSQTHYHTFFGFVDFLNWLTKMQKASEKLLESNKVGPVDAAEQVVELELVEYAGDLGIEPYRLQEFITNVGELYTVVAIVLKKPSHFTFRYFDSGSNFLAGIVSVKAIAEAVNTFVNQWFDRFRFWTYDKFDRDLSTIGKTLDLASKVQEQVRHGTITPEDGRNLTERALQAMERLTEIGVTPVVRGTEVSIERKQLLNAMRKTKLLTGETVEQQGSDITETS